MIDGLFHFSEPWWFLALLVLVPMKMWLAYWDKNGLDSRIQAYADEDLLPYLTGSRALMKGESQWRFLQWSLLWLCLVIAMAGPRWDYIRTSVFSQNAELVVLLDLSRSMNVQDESPSRLVRAKQEIADLLSMQESIRIGLVIFGSIAHVMHPLTQDQQVLAEYLPLLNTDLLTFSGSRLSFALTCAMSLFSREDETVSRHILLLTDGDFSPENVDGIIQQMQTRNIFMHVLALGTPAGGTIPDANGVLKDGLGKPIISRLELASLVRLTEQNKGLLLQANYRDTDIQQIMSLVKKDVELKQDTQLQTKIWNEQFYWYLLPLMLLLLPKFRRFWPLDALGKRL